MDSVLKPSVLSRSQCSPFLPQSLQAQAGVDRASGLLVSGRHCQLPELLVASWLELRAAPRFLAPDDSRPTCIHCSGPTWSSHDAPVIPSPTHLAQSALTALPPDRCYSQPHLTAISMKHCHSSDFFSAF